MSKIGRTAFVCVFTTLFAMIAIMGEGLHFVPGLGHSCGQSHDSDHFSSKDRNVDDCCRHHSAVAMYSDLDLDKSVDAADCAICKYFSLAKPCLLASFTTFDYLTITECLPDYSSILESRFIGSYHSRAPPRDMSHIS
jgi:hypothetical protein